MRGLFFCDASYQGTASVVPNKTICELELQPLTWVPNSTFLWLSGAFRWITEILKK